VVAATAPGHGDKRVCTAPIRRVRSETGDQCIGEIAFDKAAAQERCKWRRSAAPWPILVVLGGSSSGVMRRL
jgi:hypothetical protein